MTREDKATAQYVDVSRKPDERCGICSMFIRPDMCIKVKGVISAKGWCQFFYKKEDKK